MTMEQAGAPRTSGLKRFIVSGPALVALLSADQALAQTFIDAGDEEVVDNTAQSTQPNPWDTGFLQVDGTLTIGETGAVTSSITYVGGDPAAANPARVSVTGSGAQWTLTDGLFVGDINDGDMTVGAGGTVTSSYGIVGSSDGVLGTVNVAGQNALWENTITLSIANYGQGEMTVGAGGTVTNTVGYIGSFAGSNGVVTVSGDQARWQNSGDLVVGSAGTGALNIGAGGTVTNLNTFVGSFADGDGTVVVDGDNARWQNAGALIVGAQGSGAVDINNGTVSSQSGTLGSAAGADGRVRVAGDTANWNSTDGIVVGFEGSGELAIEDGALASSGAVVLGAAASGSGTLSLSGTAGARGTLETGIVQKQDGAGTVTLDGGVLRATADEGDFLSGFSSGEVRIDAGGAWLDNNGHDVGIQTDLQGAGGLTKIGAGTLVLSGANTYQGATNVETGTLIVNGDLTSSPLTVHNGAGLGGTGTVGTTSLGAGSTLAPGNSIGTLTVDGDLTFDSDTTYQVEVAPDGSSGDRVQVTGQARLNGAEVAHIGNNGNYRPATVYTILSADGGLDGTFGGVTSDYAFLVADLFYDANNVYLQLARDSYASFTDRAVTDNQLAVAGSAEKLGPGNDIYSTLLALPDNNALIRGAFDQLAGEIHASVRSALVEDSRFLRDTAGARLRAAFQERPVGTVVWSRAYGNWGETDRDGSGAASMDHSSGGLLIGADAPLNQTWRLGLLAGAGRTSVDIDDREASGSSDDYHLGLYSGGRWDALRLTAGLGYTWHEIETDRRVAFDDFDQTLRGDNRADTVQLFGEAGYRLDTDALELEPFVGLAQVRLSSDGGDEDGGAAALHDDGDRTDTTFSTLGLRAATGLGIAGVPARLHGTLGWRHAFGDTESEVTQSFAGGQAFTVSGVPIAEDAAVVKAGLELGLSERATLGLSYSGQLAGDRRDHGLGASFEMQF
jgi:subtilase-type serine protease